MNPRLDQAPTIESNSLDRRITNANPDEIAAVFGAQSELIKEKQGYGEDVTADIAGLGAAQILFETWQTHPQEEIGGFLDAINSLSDRAQQNDPTLLLPKEGKQRAIDAAAWLEASGFRDQLGIEVRVNAPETEDVREAIQAEVEDQEWERTFTLNSAKDGTISADTAKSLLEDLDVKSSAVDAASKLEKEWEADGSATDTSFPKYVQQRISQFTGEPGGEEAIALLHAQRWVRTSYKDSLRTHFESQDEVAKQESAPIEQPSAPPPTEAEIAESHQREADRKALETESARHKVEALHTNSEITNTVIQIGKGKTSIRAPYLQGTTQYGDIQPKEASLLDEQIRNARVAHAFGETDEYGQLKPAQGEDWRTRPDTAERVLFMPSITHETRTETTTRVVEKKRIGRNVTEDVHIEVPVPGSEHQKTILNPKTGEQEPAVIFQYDFDPNVLGTDAMESIRYTEINGGRVGASLSVALELPKSVADKLLATVEKEPAFVREIAEALVTSNSKTADGAITKEDWQGNPDKRRSPVRPPYERAQQEAPGWKIAIAKPKPGATIESFDRSQKGSGLVVSKHLVE